MGDFFKPLRRKIGVVAIVALSVFAALAISIFLWLIAEIFFLREERPPGGIIFRNH